MICRIFLEANYGFLVIVREYIQVWYISLRRLAKIMQANALATAIIYLETVRMLQVC